MAKLDLSERVINLILFATLSVFSSHSAAGKASVVVRCGASAGYAYFFEGDLVPPGQGGWKRESISNGSIDLVVDNGQYDIHFRDALGKTRSHRNEGSDVQLISLNKSNGSFLILSTNKAGVVEHFLFKLGASGNGNLAWGTIRTSNTFVKSSIMNSYCDRP